MTEIEFFNILMDKLNTLPESQLYDIINYYKNYLSSRSASQEDLKEILHDLEDPNFLVNILVNRNNNLDAKNNLESLTKTESKHTITPDNTPYEKSIPFANISRSLNIDTLLKIGIIILSLVILLPLLTTIVAITFSICELNIKIIVSSLSLILGYPLNSRILDLLPEFIFNFPKASLFLFTVGTSLLSLFLLISLWYIVKTICLIIKNILSKLNNHTDTEDL